MIKSKKVQAGDSENEFDVDDPEEVGEYSEDKSISTAAVCFIIIILCYE